MTTSYEEAVTGLYRLQKFGIKFGLSKTANLLEALGNPHKNQTYIHIGGTNGKGSTAAFMASILQASGLKVGLYTSPHLVRFTERFKINNKEIPKDTAESLIRELTKTFIPNEPPTFFEAATAMALMYFALEKTDIAIMEVGMGGRLDATNVITPLVSVITNISLEHKFYLGNTLLDIAGEKGGIIKKGVDLVTGVTQPAVIRLFESIAQERGTVVFRLGKNAHYRVNGSGLRFYGSKYRLNKLRSGLMGKYQHKNAALAIAAIERLTEKGFSLSEQDLRKGLEDITWPGRMQIINNAPLTIIDGAHNPSAMRMLTDTIRSDFGNRRLILVIGIMEDKEIRSMLEAIVPVADHIIFTRPVYNRAADPAVLKAQAGFINTPHQVMQNLSEALNAANKTAKADDLILVTGSLFTAGEALSYFDPALYGPDLMPNN